MIDEDKGLCPYCWEELYFEIDTSIEEQEYVEDCQVCCNPILLTVKIYEGSINIDTAKEDDGF